MSGIAGIFCLDNRQANRKDIEKMVDVMAHRGPDGAGVWHEGSVGLGHRMLWTTPESLEEEQPLVGHNGKLVLTADARIDNRDELIASLSLRHRRPREITDSHLILAAYEKWGERCPEKLIGDFAFAIWDSYKQQLFCARDCFGIKPFYYYRSSRIFAFGTEIKALLCLSEVPHRINEVKVADYLTNLAEDKVITFYQEIFRLPPANSLVVDHSGFRLQEYWSLDPSFENEISYGSDEEYAEAFLEIFTEAVRCRLRSAFPVGFALSGGLDSSSIVGVAQRLATGNSCPPLHAFSAVFDEVPECDERSFIKAVLDQGGIESHYIHMDQFGVLDDIDRTLWHLDQPLYVRNIFLLTTMYRAAQQQGVRVMLDGEDGDTVVSHGNGYFAELARAGQWAKFAKEAHDMYCHFENYGSSSKYWLRAYGFIYLSELARTGRWISFAKAANEISRHFGDSRRHLYLQQGLKSLIPESLLRVRRELPRRRSPTRNDEHLINASFAKRVRFKERRKKLLERYVPARTLREEHWLGLTAGITSCVEEEDDKAAASFAIEKRHPFWDRRVVEFCLSLPPEQKLHNGWPRWILRRAMAGLLPDEIRWRVGKSNLSPNFAHSLFSLESGRLEDLFLKDLQVIEPYVNVSFLHDAYLKENASTIWPALILALWLRQTELAP